MDADEADKADEADRADKGAMKSARPLCLLRPLRPFF